MDSEKRRRIRPWRLVREFRSSGRLLARNPFVNTAAILTLAVGIGTCTTMFSVADSLLLRSLEYPEPDRLVMLWESHPRQKGDWRLASYPAFEVWRDRVESLEELAANRPWRPILTGGETLTSVGGAKVSAGFFSLLGVEPTLGRGFAPADQEPGSPPVLVLSHGLWQRRFGGAPEILGSTLSLDDSGTAVEATVIGILPAGARIAEPVVSELAEIFMPLIPDPDRGKRYFRVVGRLAPGVAIEQAAARLTTLSRGLREHYPETHADWQGRIAFLEEIVETPVRPALVALLAAVTLVFVIACTNVGLLLLARENDRQRELAVRQALGAGPLWIGRRLLAENLLLCGTGGVLGLALARAGLAALEGLGLTAGKTVGIDPRTILFTLALSLTTTLLFALVPAARAAGTDIGAVLRAPNRQRGDRSSGRLRRALVLSEIAVAAVLLVASGLMIRSCLRLISVDPGFDPQGALALRLQLPRSLHPDFTEMEDLMERLRQEVESSPRVEAAGLVNYLPMAGVSVGTRVRALPATGPDHDLGVELRGVSRDYFRSMRIPLISGRDLESVARERERSVILLSEAAARRLWPGEPAVGKRLVLDWGSGEPREVIGVVGTVAQHGARSRANPAVYVPFPEAPHRTLTLVARTSQAVPVTLAGEIKSRALEVDRTFVIDRVVTLSEVVRGTISLPEGQAMVLTGFALVAVVLAAGGVYSVVAYSLTQRRYDLGVRLTLGARPQELIKVMTSERLRDATVGIGIGLTVSLAGTRLFSGLLYGVGAQDPWTLAATSLLLLGIVLAASHLAARKASVIDPAVVLRQA